ncbi:MAG: class I SAM-dependent methyltransferase [Anaerolineales bacterium]
MALNPESSDPDVRRTLDFLSSALSGYGERDFSVRLWDSTVLPAETAPPRFTLVLNHPGALRRMLADPTSDLRIGEAYIYNDFDIEGDIEAVYPVAEYLASRDWSWTDRLRLGWELLHLPGTGANRAGRQAASVTGQPHTIDRDRQAISYHYDVSNDFYALWLDSRLVYSCAYFENPADDLDAAQERKLEYICRKLRLNEGERLLDIGCGWGGLVVYAAQRYGVQALGITLSQPQAELASQRIRQAGLQNLCRVEVRDYRQIDDPGGFDKLVSVGMFEHVGEALLPVYFQKAWRLLKNGGVFLNHGIANNSSRPPQKSPTFSNRYVFPDGELVPVHTSLLHAENTGFEVLDVENLRRHYALTLRHWVRRLEANRERALRFVDEPTYRIWRLFMSGSAYGFDAGYLNVFQSLLLKTEKGETGLPLTRADWYA